MAPTSSLPPTPLPGEALAGTPHVRLVVAVVTVYEVEGVVTAVRKVVGVP
ncbi:hypothetical protein E2C01_049230 [Portunus trituberculatus]|uniref:Uncharacterized protein n=1 Tax=Portunus trituberculatus TaxID=210409 RepID=A0A5B7GDN8_PORTR|nr:hypothetical protein [Portunus trituberculatus]